METTLTIPRFEHMLLRGDVESLEAAGLPDAACLAAGYIDPFLPDVPPTSILSAHTLSVQLAHQIASHALSSVTITSPLLEQVFTDLSTDSSPHGLISAYVAGVALLHAFLRENWTGPALSSYTYHNPSAPKDNSAFYLSLDGEDIASPAVYLYCLRAARFILVESLPLFTRAGAQLIHWWAARTLVAHQFILSNPSPTLQTSIFSQFASFLPPHAANTQSFLTAQHINLTLNSESTDVANPDLAPSVAEHEGAAPTDRQNQSAFANIFEHSSTDASLKALAYLELSLAQRLFYDGDGALASLKQACQALQITVTVSGQLGVRTKHQSKPVSQLIARSFQLASSSNSLRPDLTLAKLSFLIPTSDRSSSSSASSLGLHAHQLPTPPHVGIDDPDVLGYVKLSSVPGATDPQGRPRYPRPESDPDEGQTDEDESDDETDNHQLFPDSMLGEELEYLTPLEQALALAHAGIVHARNATHLLTSQQMAPFIDLVLRNAESPHGSSSIVQLRALLHRASFEANRGRYLERCMAQLEQVTNFVQDKMRDQPHLLRARSTAERIAFSFASSLPPRWELMKELALMYGKIGMVKSAMEFFKQLEMWDELVDCHRLVGELSRAESLVRERLQSLDNAVLNDGHIPEGQVAFDPSNPVSNRAVQERATRRPRLLCVLGEITREEKHFKTAWTESGGRYARAKRALARRCLERKMWQEAVNHYKDALNLNPLFPEDWFNYGCAAIEIADLHLAAQAFTMVVKLTPDHAEAWNNLGRVLYDTGKKKEALRAMFEAGKARRESWRIWENVVNIATEIKSCLDIVRAMERLVELRGRAGVIAASLGVAVSEVIRMSSSDDAEDKAMFKSVWKRLLRLLGRCTAVVSSDASVWAAYAELHEVVPDAQSRQKAFDCRLKQIRALMASGFWKSERNEFRHMVAACDAMYRVALASGSDENVRSTKMQVDNVLNQAGDHFRDHESYAQLQQLQQKFNN